MHVTEDEKKIIKAALAFVNLRRLTAAQAERVFDVLIKQEAMVYYERTPYTNAALWQLPQGFVLPGSPVLDMDDLRLRLQNQVREWFSAIASGDEARRGSVDSEVERFMAAAYREPISMVYRERSLKIRYRFASAPACLALTAALILDRDRGLTDKLGQCGAPGCGKFRLDFKGKPRRHCNEAHRRLADAADAPRRMRPYRERLKKRERQMREKAMELYRNGAPIEQIAKQVGKSIGTVKKWIK